MEIKPVFTKMPSEVFEQFIQPKLEFDIESLPILEAFITAPNWAEYFRHKSLNYWVNVEWAKICVPFKDALVNDEAKVLACELVNAFGESGTGKPAVRANVQDSKARFESCATFAKSYGKFPKPVVCLDTGGSWVLLDGFHRLAAILSMEEHENFPFDCWLGTHPQPDVQLGIARSGRAG